MTSGLVNASFSLPEWQAVKMIFFAPCYCEQIQRAVRVGLELGASEWQVHCSNHLVKLLR